MNTFTPHIMEKGTYNEQTGSELKDTLNNDKMKPLVLEAIEVSAITYFESLKRRWKVENDQAKLEKREILNMQNKRDARTRAVCAVLRVNHIIL